eukprot:2315178-Prymnesium_polylepis.1
MGACAAQALAVRLSRLLLVASRVARACSARADAGCVVGVDRCQRNAETCGSAGSTLGSRCVSA